MLDLSRTLRLIRRRWATIFVVASMTLIAGAIYTHLTPKMYGSQVQFWVSSSDSSDPSQLVQGSAFLSKQIVSYVELLKTPMMLETVADASGVDISPGELARATTVSNPPGSVLLFVYVELPSSEDAARLARAYANSFPETVNEIDRVGEQAAAPVKVSVVGRPKQATAPSSPKPINNLAAALVLGLLLGLMAAEARQMFDSKVRSKQDVEEIAGRPLLGSVPFDADTQAHPLAIDEARQSKRAEAYRSLRTNLQFVDVADHPRVIVVTSSLPHEGKSTTIANLALALMRGGQRVCMVEADLRRPKLLEYLGLSGTVGLTDVLIGKCPLGDVVQPYGVGGLAVIGSGPLPPNPSELLGSSAIVEVLKELSELFDYVLLDGAPLLPVTDSAVLSAHADGALLVASYGMVSRDQFGVAVETLQRAQANLLGVILNRVPRASLGANAYGSSYYYYSSREARTDDAPNSSVPPPAAIRFGTQGPRSSALTGGSPIGTTSPRSPSTAEADATVDGSDPTNTFSEQSDVAEDHSGELADLQPGAEGNPSYEAPGFDSGHEARADEETSHQSLSDEVEPSEELAEVPSSRES